ncbi:hypothetical protein OS128_03310 [Corynebacterium sp. P5848]|uniref:hypothetical protein n=1 Tax=Corynebacterium marambiense TaxID=2765364 RepID=UPI002260F2B3|nr:hypothetical protein [Corynebacterium marambiense]MCX7541942.1 hypothetical protein [Corynebacterium marambiense]
MCKKKRFQKYWKTEVINPVAEFQEPEDSDSETTTKTPLNIAGALYFPNASNSHPCHPSPGDKYSWDRRRITVKYADEDAWIELFKRKMGKLS